MDEWFAAAPVDKNLRQRDRYTDKKSERTVEIRTAMIHNAATPSVYRLKRGGLGRVLAPSKRLGTLGME